MDQKRWWVLALVVATQAATTWLANAPLFLVAHLHLNRGMSLAQAGLLASASLVGGLLTLIAWGGVVDRYGERKALITGLTIATAAGLASAAADSTERLAAAWLVVGVGAASINSASGRLIVGWFPVDQRGTAMGIRQTALPLGAGAAAFIEPVVADRSGLGWAMVVPATGCAIALAATVIGVVDPPRPATAGNSAAGAPANPYRGDRRLIRIHVASVLLVIPQITIWTYAIVWLMDDRGWSAAAAGGLAATTQLLGAAGRVGAGWWSDRVHSRLRPLRTISVCAAATMLLLGLTASTPIAIAVLVVAAVVTVADNGLAFTSVAEIGGPAWAGRALGVQNTGQYLAAALVPPGIGALIAERGFGFAFAFVAVFALLAVVAVPREDAQRCSP